MILKKSNAFVLFREEFYIDSAESEVSDLDEAVLASPEQNDSHVCLMNNTARTAVYVFHVVMTFLSPLFSSGRDGPCDCVERFPGNTS